MACHEAVAILERGWQDGVDDATFRNVINHLNECEECRRTAGRWFRAEHAIAELAAALDRSLPRSSIADRVQAEIERSSNVGNDACPQERAHLLRLLTRLEHDVVLRQALAGAVDRNSILKRLVAMGADLGLPFSMETVCSALTQQRAANDGELSDEQLEAVAGGASSEQLALLHELVSGVQHDAGRSN